MIPIPHPSDVITPENLRDLFEHHPPTALVRMLANAAIATAAVVSSPGTSAAGSPT